MKIPPKKATLMATTKNKQKSKEKLKNKNNNNNSVDEQNVIDDLQNINLRSDDEEQISTNKKNKVKSVEKKQRIKRRSNGDAVVQISDNTQSEGEDSEKRLSEAERPDDKLLRRGNRGSVVYGASLEGDDDDNDYIPSVEESDSSEDEVGPRNTIGDVPLRFYEDEEHIGYTISGKKIKKREILDKLAKFLVSVDNKKDWRIILDEYNDEEVEFTKSELDFLLRVMSGKTPHADVNPFADYVDYFVYEDKGHPLSNAPEPKRRFIPSKWERKTIMKLVRAIREGRIKLNMPKVAKPLTDLWGGDSTSYRNTRGLTYIPPPKLKMPGHEESYNPSPEYIPTQEEIDSYQLMYEEDRPKVIPRKYASLRSVPAYPNALQERQGRCFDLYLCPRVRKKRLDIDPESLKKNDRPKRKDLKPYPSTCFIEYRGHSGAVVSISPEVTGQWIASGSSDGTVRVWEVATGRCVRIWEFDHAIKQVAWNPLPQLPILAVSVGSDVFILDTGLGSEEEQKSIKDLLHIQNVDAVDESGNSAIVSWLPDDKHGGARLKHFKTVSFIQWHRRGDYLSTVMPAGESKGVMIHQLSKKFSQALNFRLHGLPVSTAFHPTRSEFYIATRKNIRLYDLRKTKKEESFIKKLETNLREVSCIAIHPGGDNVLVGSREGKWCWFDTDLSSKPYKTLKGHSSDITNVAFHRSYPLFASCSEDGQAYVYHGMVYSDLNKDPLLVPLTKFKGHSSSKGRGVLDCKFHPRQPWLFTAGADSVIKLYCH